LADVQVGTTLGLFLNPQRIHLFGTSGKRIGGAP
jgi:hypothetical protein